MRHLVWFSCGASSAVAAQIAVEKWPETAEVLYCNTLASEHPDNARFLKDVAAWIGRDIRLLSSERYSDVNDVIRQRRYMAGPSGALCTTELKKLPRQRYQRHDDIHVFGYTADEEHRIERFERNNPELCVEWVLRDRGITKQDCLTRLTLAGIPLPEMYRLGYDHNNCLGCVKATSPRYWNNIRRDFPEVFTKRAQQSRLLGVRLARVKGQRVYLDELPADTTETISEDIECGPVCQSGETAAAALAARGEEI